MVSFGGFARGVGDFLGVTGPDTKEVSADTEEMRRMRQQFLDEYNQTGARDVPQVTAGRASFYDPGQATTIGGPRIERTDGVSAPILGQTERASAAAAGAAFVPRVDPVSRVQIDPAKQASVREIEGAKIDTLPQEESRGDQRFLSTNLKDVIAGKGPSVAELQGREMLGQAAKDQQSFAAGVRGAGAGAARRRAAREMGRLQGNASAQSALLRAQETTQARGQLAGLATDTRGQDLSLAQGQAGLEQGARLANQAGYNAGTMFNAGQMNDIARANAAMEMQRLDANANRAQAANLFESGQTTDVNKFNAGNTTNVNLANAAAGNDMTKFGAGQELTARTGNADRDQGTNLAQGNIDLATLRANQDALNRRGEFVSTGYTDTDRFNVTEGNKVATGNADRTIDSRRTDDTNRASLRGDTIQAGSAAQGGANAKLAAEEAGKSRRTELISGVAKSGAGALMAMSDERAKRDVKGLPSDAVESFLDEVKPKSFEYKHGGPGTAPGRRFGVMAQDVDDSDIGASFVVPTKKGLALDGAQAVGPLIVAIKHVNDKIDALTKRRLGAAKEMPRAA